LKGLARSEEEKRAIKEIADKVAKNGKIKSEIDIAPKRTRK